MAELSVIPVREVIGTPLFPNQSQLNTGALVDELSLYVGAGILKQITGFNDGATTVYAQMYDSAVVPGAADVPIQSIKLLANSGFGWSPGNWDLVNGLWVALSTTPIGFTTGGVSLWANCILWVP